MTGILNLRKASCVYVCMCVCVRVYVLQEGGRHQVWVDQGEHWDGSDKCYFSRKLSKDRTANRVAVTHQYQL